VTARRTSEAPSAATEALAAIDDVRRRLGSAQATDEIAALATELRGRLEDSLRAFETAVRAGREQAGAVASGVQRTMQEEFEEAERRIRENPLGAVLVAAGLGLLAGLLLRRR